MRLRSETVTTFKVNGTRILASFRRNQHLCRVTYALALKLVLRLHDLEDTRHTDVLWINEENKRHTLSGVPCQGSV